MAILRAGPFGSQSGFGSMHQDEPDIPTTSILPINCAISDWVNDAWRTGFSERISNVSSPYSYIPGPVITKSFTGTSGQSSLGLAFLYQAAEEFTFTFTYAVTSDGFGSVAQAVASAPDFSFIDQEVGIIDEEVSVSGSIIVTCPKRVFPGLVNVSVSGTLVSSGSLSISHSP